MSKYIHFTKHAKQRSYERDLGHYIKLCSDFRKAKLIVKGFWADLYEDENHVVYVVNEKENWFTIISVWRREKRKNASG